MRRAAPASRPLPLALIIDADADTREMYATFLVANGWRIELAPDGPTGLAAALSVRPDVIVTEAILPGMDGFALCRVLRSDPLTRQTPIVLITATARPEDVERARRLRADLLLTKPILPETMLDEVTRLWQQAVAVRAPVLPRPTPQREAVVREAAASRQTKQDRQLWAAQRGSTTTPPRPPPTLRCPTCDRVLAYQRSHIGGVSQSQPEQWDYFQCAGCGVDYQYRVRTRRVRRVT